MLPCRETRQRRWKRRKIIFKLFPAVSITGESRSANWRRVIQVAADDRRQERGGGRQEAGIGPVGKRRKDITAIAGFQEGVEWMRILQSARFDFASTPSGYAVIQELPLLHGLRKCTTNLGLSLTRETGRKRNGEGERERARWSAKRRKERERERDRRTRRGGEEGRN